MLALFIASCLGLSLALPPSARAQQGAAPTSQRYVIDAHLTSTEPPTLDGTFAIHFTNHSALPLHALWFQLGLNAFRDRRSVLMRESRGKLRGARFKGAGSITLHRLTVDDADLLPRAEDELVRGDHTQLRVPLPSALAPKTAVRIQGRFSARLPPAFARTGYAGDFILAGQWFPKLAKLGAGGRFESEPYHALAEFSADFADYDVTLHLPPAYRVVASGARVQDTAHPVHHFRAKRIHDFAWAAGARYEETVEQLGPVEVRYLAPHGTSREVAAHADIVRKGLARFGALLAPYPHPHLAVVMPPASAPSLAAMEFPALFVTGEAGSATEAWPRAGEAWKTVTAHELAHQWFFGWVASDERRYPVLDEGLTEWAALHLMQALGGCKQRLGWLVDDDCFELERLSLSAASSHTPASLAASAYAEPEVFPVVYARTAVALESLRRSHGHERFDRALRRYVLQNRGRHVSLARLSEAFDRAYGAGFSQRTLIPLVFEGRVPRLQIVEARGGAIPGGFRTEVRARRAGGVALPSWLAAYGAHGRELRRVAFPERAQSLHVTFDTPQRVHRVALDPDRSHLLDLGAAERLKLLPGASADAPPGPWLLAIAQLLLAWASP